MLTSINDIREKFSQAVTDAVLDIINTSGINSIGAELSRYNVMLGLQLDNDDYYGKLVSKNQIQRVHEKLLHQNFTKVTDLSTKFNEAVVLAMITTSNHGELREVVENNNSLLGLDLTGDYAKLNDIDKGEVMKAIMGKDTLSEVEEAFSQRVRQLMNEIGDDNDDSGSTGGKGKSSTITASPIIPTIIPTVTPMPTPVKKEFSDIGTVEWAKESIKTLADAEIIKGFQDGTFRPDDKLTREQFVKMIILALNIPVDTGESSYSDINKDEWYSNYIVAAEKNGIINGLPDGTFGVGKEISRQEMAVIAYRAAKAANVKLDEANPEVDFTDTLDIDDYAVDNIKTMQKAGIFSGNDKKEFQPKELSTRAQAAKVICGLYKLNSF